MNGTAKSVPVDAELRKRCAAYVAADAIMEHAARDYSAGSYTDACRALNRAAGNLARWVVLLIRESDGETL